MKDIRRNIITIGIVLGLIFFLLCSYFLYDVFMFSGRWIGSSYNPRLKDSRSTVVPGSIYDINGVELAGSTYGKRTYSTNDLLRTTTSHVIGDLYGFSPLGVETTQGSWLLGYNENLVDRIRRLMFDETAYGKDITLTIDSDLCLFIANQMNINKGAVVVLNYKTGEILAMVSGPSFDPEMINPGKENGGADEDSLSNRSIQGQYPPGDLFQVITASAAMEHLEFTDREFYCNGTYQVDDEIIICSRAHANQSFEEVIQNSCDSIFAKLSIDLGASNLQKSAERAGFNQQFLFDDIVLYNSSISLNSLTSQYNLALSANGEYNTLVTPMHMAMLYGAIANRGEMIELKLISSIEDQENDNNIKSIGKSFSYAIAEKLDGILIIDMSKYSLSKIDEDTKKYHGKTAKVKATDENESMLTWFAGYMKDDKYPYAIAIVLEDNQSYIENIEEIALNIFKEIKND